MKEKFAIERDRRRLLQGNEELPLLSDELKYLTITDAIEIFVLDSEDDSDETPLKTPIRWEVTEYRPEEMSLLIDFSDLEAEQHEDRRSFDTVVVTFWGTKYLRDRNMREVPIGTQIEWKIFR